jgi:energy-coupling factor transporter ATP-binding protein EcfA2
MVTESRPHDVVTDLVRLATSLEALSIPATTDRDRLGARRDWILRTIRGYLIPRIEDPTGPMVVVFAGPTGAGKSTLLNSVAGGDHSIAGPLRPTTKAPLVLASRDHAASYSTIGGVGCRVVTGRAPILGELTLVDTPDIDSTSLEHRAIAETMIDNADVVVYVTSASRYADLVPWEVLRRAHSRGVPVVPVLNRIKSSTSGALADYKTRLLAEGLTSEVVAVHEHHLAKGAQSVPLAVIQELRDRLVDVVSARRAGTTDAVRSVLETTLDEVGDVIGRVNEMATDTIDATDRARGELLVDLDRLLTRLRTNAGAHLDLAPLASLASRWFRIGWLVRRNLPPAAAIAANHRLLDASLVATVDADIRRQVGGGSPIQREQASQLLGDTHSAVKAAIATWHQDLDDFPQVIGAIDRRLASLLLARCSVEGHDPEMDAVFDLLTGSDDVAASVAWARERLEVHLLPVYSGVEYQVTSQLAMGVATDDALYRARVSLSAVIARSSFAHA